MARVARTVSGVLLAYLRRNLWYEYRYMSVNTTENYPGSIRPVHEDELDLRLYLGILLHWWREILLLTLLFPILVFALATWFSRDEVPLYTAEAQVVIARITSTIELDERVSTTASASQTDQLIWRNSLLAHAVSDDIARVVTEQLKDELPAEMQSPSVLARMVKADIASGSDTRSSSNIIQISVTTPDPEISARVADTWAVAFVDYVNNLYGEVPEATLLRVEEERQRARTAYEAAQAEYEAYLGNNRLNELNRQITVKDSLRTAIIASAVQIANTVAVSETVARLELYQALMGLPAESQLEAVQLQQRDNRSRLAQTLEERQVLEGILRRARVMEDSLVAGGEGAAASNALALEILKVDAFARLPEEVGRKVLSIGATPGTLVTLDAQLADVRGLIAALETTLAGLDTEIAERYQYQVATPELAALDAMVTTNAAGQPVLVQPASAAYTASLAAAYAGLLTPPSVLGELPLVARGGMDAATEQFVAQLEVELRELQAQLAVEQARQQDMVRTREIAWNAYDAMLTKAQELNVLRSSSNSELRMGSRALVPARPDPEPSLLVPLVASGLIGLFLAALVALVSNALGVDAWFARIRPAKLQRA